MSVAAVRRVVSRLAPNVSSHTSHNSQVLTDAELVVAISPQCAEREAAFGVLIDRYGPMVLGVCRRVLADIHDAEDAFQAAFLVLARKADTIRPPGAVAGFLYGVAVRTARKAKTAAARRRRREMTATTANSGKASRERERPETALDQAELRAVIDTELAALPKTHRAAVVLCDLHGKTRAEAAAELNKPEGTVAAWLARGRKALAARLAKRGVTLPTAGLVSIAAPAAVSAKLASTAFAAIGRNVSPAVLALAESVMRNLASGATKLVAAVVAVGAILAAVATAGAWPTGQPQPPAASPPTRPAPPTDPKPKPEPVAASVLWKEKRVIDLPGWFGGSVAFSPDGEWFYVGGTSGNVRAYSTSTFKQRWETKEGEHFASLAPAGNGLLAVTFKDGVRLLAPDSGKTLGVLEEKGSAPLAVGYSGSRPGVGVRQVIFGNASGYCVKTWGWDDWPKVATTTTRTVAPGKKPADEYAVPLAVAPIREEKLAVVSGPIDPDTGKNALWIGEIGADKPDQVLKGHKAAVTSAAWAPLTKQQWSGLESTIITGDAEGTVIVWFWEVKAKESSRLSLGGRVVAVALSPDCKYAAAAVVRPVPGVGNGSYTEEVFVWETRKPPAKPEPVSRHEARGPFAGLASLAFSPDGQSLVSGFANFTHLLSDRLLVGRVRVFAPPAEKLAPPVVSVNFSPDGTRYLALRGDKAEVHDTATGKRLYAVPAEAAALVEGGKVTEAVAGMVPVRPVVLAGMGPEEITFFNPADGTPTATHPRPKTKWGWNQVAFSPDGKRFAAHFGLHVRIYDTATGAEPVRLDDQFEQAGWLQGAAVPALAFSRDGKKLLASGVKLNAEGQMGAAVYEVSTGERLHTFTPNSKDGISAITLAPSGDAVAVGYADRVEVWVVGGAPGKVDPARKFETRDPVTALAYSADGKTLAVGLRRGAYYRWWADVRKAYQGEVLLLDATTGKELRWLDGFQRNSSVLLDDGKVQEPNADNLRGHTGVWYDPLVVSLAFSPDSKKLLAATGLSHIDGLPVPGARGEVKMFDLTAPEPPAPAGRQWTDAAILTEHKALVNAVAVNPDGSSFVAATEGTVVCWDMATRKKLWEYKAGGPVYALAYTGDRSVAATGAKATTLLDAKTGKAIAAPILQGRARPDRVLAGGRAVAFAPDPPRIAVSDGYAASIEYLPPLNGSVVLAERPENKEIPPVIAAGVAWSADGKRVAFVPHDRTAGKWAVVVADAFNGKPDRLLTGHDVRPACVAWSADGKLLVSGDGKGTIIAWDAGTGKELWRRQFRGRDDTDGRINALALSPADNTVAAAMALGSGKGPERVVLLDGKTGKDVEHIMRPWGDPLTVTSVAWSKDGKYLVTGCGSYLGQPVPQDKELLGEVVVWERKSGP